MAEFWGSAKTPILSGTASVDIFHGGDSNVTFIGNGGQDHFYGGYRTSLIDYRWAPGPIRISLLIIGEFQNTGAAGWNLLRDIDGIYGSAFADTLIGGNGANWLSGEGGDDLLQGGWGPDTLIGGSGNDTLMGGTHDDILSGGVGNDRLFGGSQNDHLDGGSGADVLYGELGDDVLLGGTGDDVLIGGPGADQIIGGPAHDIASYSNAGAAVLINLLDLSGRWNTGDASGDTFGEIEEFELTSFDDVFFAKVDAAIVHGGAGNDRISGAGGKDWLYGDAGEDYIDGGPENDVLFGGDGRDVLVGGTGIDDLYGGRGADRFVFRSLADQASHPDQIRDFSRAEGDKIDLSAIDAITGGRDDAFRFIGKSAFSGVAGQLAIREASGGGWNILVDVNGDGRADFMILSTSGPEPVASDFIL